MKIEDSIVIPDILFSQKVDDEVVILDTASEEYFGLDEIGAVIWQHLHEHGSLYRAYTSMQEQYEVDAKQLEADICRFVQELVDAGLVKVVV